MKKTITAIAVVLIIVVALVATNKKETAIDNGKQTIKIGFGVPLTGDVAYAGIPAKQAAEMAIEEWVSEDTKYNYELVIEDHKFESKTVATATRKMVYVDKVNAMISFWGVPGKIISALNNSNDHKVPHIACAWGETVREGDYNFNNCPTTNSYAKLLVRELQERGYDEIGLVLQNNADEMEMKPIIEKALQDAGIKIVFNELFNPGDMDFRTFLSKVQNDHVDIIYFHLFTNELNAFHKQLKEFGMDDIPLTTTDYFDEVEDLAPFEGFWFITDNAGDREFMKEWDASGKMTRRSCTMNSYDNINILITAFENADAEEGKVPTSESIIEELNKMEEWLGVAGDLIFRDNGAIDYTPKVGVIKNGKIEIED